MPSRTVCKNICLVTGILRSVVCKVRLARDFSRPDLLQLAMKSVSVLFCKFSLLYSFSHANVFFLNSIGVLGVSVAQTVTIDPVGNVTVVEGNNLTITCTDEVNGGNTLILLENGSQLIGDNIPPNEVNGVVRVFYLTVDRMKSGNTYVCESVLTATTSPVMELTVTCKWSMQRLAMYTYTVLHIQCCVYIYFNVEMARV